MAESKTYLGGIPGIPAIAEKPRPKRNAWSKP